MSDNLVVGGTKLEQMNQKMDHLLAKMDKKEE
jgi:hypothetical protein